MRVPQNDPPSGQDHRVNIELRVIDLLLNIQFNLLTRTENTNNVRRNIRQYYDPPAIVNGYRQYLFSSTRLEAMTGQARRLAVAFVNFRISSSNGSSSIFLYRNGTPTTIQNHSAISLASGKTKTVPSIVVTVQPFSTWSILEDSFMLRIVENLSIPGHNPPRINLRAPENCSTDPVALASYEA